MKFASKGIRAKIHCSMNWLPIKVNISEIFMLWQVDYDFPKIANSSTKWKILIIGVRGVENLNHIIVSYNSIFCVVGKLLYILGTNKNFPHRNKIKWNYSLDFQYNFFFVLERKWCLLSLPGGFIIREFR